MRGHAGGYQKQSNVQENEARGRVENASQRHEKVLVLVREVEDPRRHHTSGVALATNCEEDADVKQEAAHHAHPAQKRLALTTDLVVPFQGQPGDESEAHRGTYGCKRQGGLAEGVVHRHVCALCGRFRGAVIVASDSLLDGEGDHDVSIRVAVARGVVVVAEQAGPRDGRERHGRNSSRIRDLRQGGVGRGEDVVRGNAHEGARRPVQEGVEHHRARQTHEEDALEPGHDILLLPRIRARRDGSVGRKCVERNRVVQSSGVVERGGIVLLRRVDYVWETRGILRHGSSWSDVTRRREAVRSEALRREVGRHLRREGFGLCRHVRRGGLVVGLWTPAKWPSSTLHDVTRGADVEQDELVPFAQPKALCREEQVAHVEARAKKQHDHRFGLLEFADDLQLSEARVERRGWLHRVHKAQPDTWLQRQESRDEVVPQLAEVLVDRRDHADRVPVVRRREREVRRQDVRGGWHHPGEVRVDLGTDEGDALHGVREHGHVKVRPNRNDAKRLRVAGRANDCVDAVAELHLHEGACRDLAVALTIVPDPLQLRIVEHVVAGVDGLDSAENSWRHVGPQVPRAFPRKKDAQL
eukprot:scaffold246_cov242-Pinguiococcus_pyrenoidosus.AAC.14